MEASFVSSSRCVYCHGNSHIKTDSSGPGARSGACGVRTQHTQEPRVGVCASPPCTWRQRRAFLLHEPRTDQRARGQWESPPSKTECVASEDEAVGDASWEQGRTFLRSESQGDLWLPHMDTGVRADALSCMYTRTCTRRHKVCFTCDSWEGL